MSSRIRTIVLFLIVLSVTSCASSKPDADDASRPTAFMNGTWIRLKTEHTGRLDIVTTMTCSDNDEQGTTCVITNVHKTNPEYNSTQRMIISQEDGTWTLRHDLTSFEPYVHYVAQTVTPTKIEGVRAPGELRLPSRFSHQIIESGILVLHYYGSGDLSMYFERVQK